MCFWFQQFLPPTLATFVLLIVGSRSIFSQPSDNTLLTTMYFGIHVRAKLEEPNIVQVKRLEGITLFPCIHQPAYWHIKGLSYSVLQKSPQKSFFFWGHKIDLLKNHMVCFDKIPSLLYWDGNGGKRTLLWWMEAKRFTENLILCWKSLWSTYWPKHDQCGWAYICYVREMLQKVALLSFWFKLE